MKTRKNCVKPLVTAIALALSFPATYAFAQQDDDNDERDGLETITVRAQKRSQNLQEVPLSLTAFTGDEMAEAVIKDVYDLQTNVPGFAAFQSQSATNSSFSIRGVGTSSQNFGLESSVGLYVDGVYRARQNSMINNLVDVEAVEVLRGPQGTLFGKNTPSGALLVRTVAPSHDGGDGFAEVTLGNYGLINWSGATSISAIEDELAFRVTAFGSTRDGIVDDVNLGDGTFNDRDRWGLRLQALYTPNDELSIRIIADRAKIDETCCAAPVQLTNFTALNVPGRFGTDAVLAQLGATLLPDGDAFFDRKVAKSFLPVSQMTDSGLSAEINYEINDKLSFVSISAYRNFDSYDKIDADFSDADLLGTVNDSTQSSFSQEIRFDYSGDNINYILGAYYFRQNLDLDYSLFGFDQLNAFVEAGFPPAFGDLKNGINLLSAATGGAIAPFAMPAPGGASFDHAAKQKHESYALFGQMDYELSEELTLTAGLRYTNESKELSTVFTETLANGDSSPNFFSSVGDPTNPSTIVPGTVIYGAGAAGIALQGIQGFLATIDPTTPQGQAAFMGFLGSAQGQQALATIAPFQTPGWIYQALTPATASRDDIAVDLDDSQVSGTIKLSYQPDRYSMYYASYGTGYKSGGTNTDRIAVGLDPVFGSEKSSAFEVGMKKDFPDQNLRVNAALHYSKVKDFQANTFTGIGFNLQNAGDLKISGLELEATWLPADMWEVKLGYARTNAKYESFLRGNCWNAFEFHNTPDGSAPADPGFSGEQYCDRTGDVPESEPKDFATLRVKRDFELSDSIFAYGLIEYAYHGEMFLDGSNDPLTLQGSYKLLNMRFYVNFDEYDMDLVLWGRNVTNEEYIGGSNFNTPLQDGKLNGYVAEPATYGLTLKKRF